MASNVMEDQGRCIVNDLVAGHEDVCITEAEDATLVSKRRLRRMQRQPQSAPAEITSVISGPSPKWTLDERDKVIKEGF
jgi:hypothetical protein